MVVTEMDNGDVYVKLANGGLLYNLESIYPAMNYEDITVLTAKVWSLNPSLYSPDIYNAGTVILIPHNEEPTDSTPTIG